MCSGLDRLYLNMLERTGMYNPILCNVIFVLCSAIFSVIAVVAAYQLKVMRMFVALGTLFSF